MSLLHDTKGSARGWVEFSGPGALYVCLALVAVLSALAYVGGMSAGLARHADATERSVDTATYYERQTLRLRAQLAGHLGLAEEAVVACLTTDAWLEAEIEAHGSVPWAEMVAEVDE